MICSQSVSFSCGTLSSFGLQNANGVCRATRCARGILCRNPQTFKKLHFLKYAIRLFRISIREFIQAKEGKGVANHWQPRLLGALIVSHCSSSDNWSPISHFENVGDGSTGVRV